MIPELPAAVATVFGSYPRNVRARLMAVRDLIFTTTANMDEVGELHETLKWGQPAYLTQSPKSGTTVRLGWVPESPNQFRVYVHCQTNLIETFRTLFPDHSCFEGNRAIVFEVSDEIEKGLLALFIEAALTYHVSKKRGKPASC